MRLIKRRIEPGRTVKDKSPRTAAHRGQGAPAKLAGGCCMRLGKVEERRVHAKILSCS